VSSDVSLRQTTNPKGSANGTADQLLAGLPTEAFDFARRDLDRPPKVVLPFMSPTFGFFQLHCAFRLARFTVHRMDNLLEL
jgi:hypothetical protein